MHDSNKFKTQLAVLFLIYNLLFLDIKAADLVVFSYNRPMQLYALLESCELYFTGLTSTTVIYRASGFDYQAGYDLVQARFEQVHFVKQQNPPHDFKNLVQQYAFDQTKSKYIMFAVDDLFVKGPVDLLNCISLLEKYQAYTFSLRLSPAINYFYILDRQMRVPPSRQVARGIYKHIFRHGQYDWAYPNSLDMNLYRKQDIKEAMLASYFDCPNRLESAWAARANLNLTGLYFSESKVVNIPINVVQEAWNLRAMHSYTTQELLTRFMRGEKIDLEPINKFKNNSVHADFEINFVER